MDDAWCAGHLVERLVTADPTLRLDDGARVAGELAGRLGSPTPAALGATGAGAAIRQLELEADLEICARVDDVKTVPVWRDGAFVKGGEEEG
ncbi:MAG: 2-phosphosulfolactate phosphatase [Gemmatimonadetes bacterium]|nr:2-phosphosulfolactate phosphatase [Gemmatimonadota bacterium]